MSNVKYYRSLARKTGNTCALCGAEFIHTGVVNREHMVPRSLKSEIGGKRDSYIMPAHVICNNFRGIMPLVKTMALLEKSRRRDPVEFSKWANRAVRDQKYSFVDPPNVTRHELVALFGDIKRLKNTQLEVWDLISDKR